MWGWLCCGSWCGRTDSRFRTRAMPVMDGLQTKIDFYANEARNYEVTATGYRKEAVQFHNKDNTAFAHTRAIQALSAQVAAERYLNIVRLLNNMLERIRTMWIQHDAVEDFSTNSAKLEELGVVQKREMEGDEELVSLPSRIATANELHQNFETLVSQMHTEVAKMEGMGTAEEKSPDDIDQWIQRWKIRPQVERLDPKHEAERERLSRQQQSLMMTRDNELDGEEPDHEDSSREREFVV